MFYGWTIVACCACATFARQGAAVATLSVFVAPMALEFGWSRAGLSGAVSLGGVAGALIAPALGSLADRSGARVMLTASAVVVALCAFALAVTPGLLWFYLAFGIGRMMFAAPFDVGVSSAVANWFERRRALAMACVSVATGVSIGIMPLIAQAGIDAGGWRLGWLVVGTASLLVGALPVAIFMRRRPEDLGLRPDGAQAPSGAPQARDGRAPLGDFSRAQALRSPAFWLLIAYTALAFCVQAGMSLHQAPHLVERGIAPGVAASIVATFSFTAAAASLGFGLLADRIPVRFAMALASAFLVVAAVLTERVSDPSSGYLSAVVFGTGIGGLLTLPPVAFAVYYGRTSYGAIRGIALPVQVVGQAAGPILAGRLHDVYGSYSGALTSFAVLAGLATFTMLVAPPPRPAAAPYRTGA